jgi:hypothetical protein
MTPINDEFMLDRIWKKLDDLHDEVHKLVIDVTEIKQWKLDQDNFEEDIKSDKITGRELGLGIIGAIGVVFGIIVAFI